MLYLGAGGAEQLRRRAGSDEFGAKVAAHVLERATGMLRQPCLTIVREAGRNVMLPTARAFEERVAFLGVAAFLTADNRYRARGLAELHGVAGFETWNPDHFLDTAEMAAAFAIGLEWFAAGSGAGEKAALLSALEALALRPALDQIASNAFWLSAAHNWNLVCGGGMIVAGCVAAKAGLPIGGQIVDRMREAMSSGLGAYKSDGAYDEGPAYWEYATRYLALATAALEHFGRAPLPDPPGLAVTWRFNRDTTTPSGRAFNYADTPANVRRSPVLGWLAGRADDPGAAEWQRAAPGEPHPYDLIWLSSSTGGAPRGSSLSCYESVGVVAVQDAAGATYLGLKAGTSALNHSHLDLGSFVLELDGDPLFDDLGPGDYAAPGYFDPQRRHEHFEVSTRAHNLVVVEGRNQALEATARIVRRIERPDRIAVEVEVDDPASPVMLQRRIAIEDGDVWILDSATRRRAAEDMEIALEWQAYSPLDLLVEGAMATLHAEERAYHAQIVYPPRMAWRTDRHEPASGVPHHRVSFGLAMTGETIEICVVISRKADPGGGQPPDWLRAREWTI